VQGCPPSPMSFMHGLTLLQEKVGREKRPLSWVVGPQGTQTEVPPSTRESRRAERRKMTVLRPPDTV